MSIQLPILSIVTHAAIDAVGIFANEVGLTPEKRILFSLSRLVIVVTYTVVLCKTLPRKDELNLR